MRITQVEAIPVRVPLKKGLTTKTAHGAHVDSPYVIVRLHTDTGLVGLGEATLAPRWSGETSPGCVAVLRDLIGPVLRGRDPRDVTACALAVDRTIKGNPFTKAAVEMALWDVAGKSAGLPVAALLGGAVRRELPMKMVVGAFPVADAVRLAERFLEWGVKCLKVKVGLNPAEDLARVKGVRERAGAGFPITVDGNCGWDVATARQMLPELARLDVCLAEQLTRAGDVREWNELRSASAIPQMADESVFSLEDAWNLSRERSVDVLAVYPGKHGGIGATRAIAHVAQAAGLRCSMGSNLELGIGTAAMLHVAAVEPSIDCERYPGDFIGPLYHEADLLRTPLELGPVVARLPTGPGLGVELDDSQLAKWRDSAGTADWRE